MLVEGSLNSAIDWITIAVNALYTAVDFISQIILVSIFNIQISRLISPPFLMKLYRCWIMWRQPLVMVIPCIISLAFLGAYLQKLTGLQTNFASQSPR